MSDQADPGRRRTLALAAGAVGGLALGSLPTSSPAAAVGGVARRAPVAQPEIRPRSAWAAGGGAVGLAGEASGDVRVLVVHHSETPNTDREDRVAARIASMHRYHTTTKGWPDIAYNFFVDRFGGIWEGRTGSLDGPVIGDATGGNQGFTQLCCFIGDHQVEPPTIEAEASMVALLAWLAGRYDVDPTPGATATFRSRGSNRWPAGVTVTVPTIAGHRDLSTTACPGDAGYALVRGRLPAAVADRMGPTPRDPVGTTTSVPTPSSSSSVPTGVSIETTVPDGRSTTSTVATPAEATGPTTGGRGGDGWGTGSAVVAVVGAVAAAVIGRRRRLASLGR